MSDFTFIFVAGIFFGISLFLSIKGIIKHSKQLRNSNGIALGPLKEKELCKHAHSWMKVYLLGLGRDGNVNMCRICGYIAGSKYMASQEMIDRLEQLERKQKLRDELYDKFVQAENSEIMRWFEAEIKSGVDVHKIMDLHVSGQTFNQRFEFYAQEQEVAEMSKKDQ